VGGQVRHRAGVLDGVAGAQVVRLLVGFGAQPHPHVSGDDQEDLLGVAVGVGGGAGAGAGVEVGGVDLDVAQRRLGDEVLVHALGAVQPGPVGAPHHLRAGGGGLVEQVGHGDA